MEAASHNWWKFDLAISYTLLPSRSIGKQVSMIYPPAKCLNTTIVIVLGITAGKRIRIGIDPFRSDRITNKVIQG